MRVKHLFLLFRISEAVELYLDLMSSLQSDITQPVRYDVNKLHITKQKKKPCF